MTIGDGVRTAVRRLRAGDRRLRVGSPAPAIRGMAPDGSSAGVETEGAELRVLFLTSDCAECQAAWKRAATASPPETFVVTPSPETDSRQKVAELSAANGVRVVMSSDAWHAFGVSKAPWMVEVRRGTVVASGPFK